MAGMNVADLTPRQREVWQAEQDYWVVTRNRDVDGFLALAHDRAAVWPLVAPLPIGRDRLRAAQQSRGEREAIIACDLTFHAIEVHGDAAIVHYTVATTGAAPPGATAATNRSLITHTWVKEHGQWRLAGGMSRQP